MKKILITQSNYIPWIGYFDAIHQADEFVVFDCVQYTRRDWRNRNKIVTKDGAKWLSVPVDAKGKYLQKIHETKISEPTWAKKHWQTISQSYSKAPFFKEYKEKLAALYEADLSANLSEVNLHFIKGFCKILGIQTKLTSFDNYEIIEGKSERIQQICHQANATHYFSGQAARSYLDITSFSENGVKVQFFDYSHYPNYPQLHGFEGVGVSIIDLIFNQGEEAKSFLNKVQLVD